MTPAGPFFPHDALTGAYYSTATPRDWPDALRALAAARHAVDGDWRLERPEFTRAR